MSVTHDLAEFGYRELGILSHLLREYCGGNWAHSNPLGSGVKAGFNAYSGCVWLEDEDYNCVMLNGDALELFVSTPYHGHEGFVSDLLLDDWDCWNQEDIDYIVSLAESLGVPVPDEKRELASAEVSK